LEIAGVTLQVGNVPSGVSPYLVPISEEQKAEYQQMPRDGFECVPSIFGNLVFAGEPESGTTGLVTIFKSPIELKLNYNSSELAELDGCEIGEDEEAVLLPVFLYTFEEDESSFSVWKPFQNYEADQDSANVKFKVWGDPPIGVTLRRAPKDWGPP
jgi:hypothetical protein